MTVAGSKDGAMKALVMPLIAKPEESARDVAQAAPDNSVAIALNGEDMPATNAAL